MLREEPRAEDKACIAAHLRARFYRDVCSGYQEVALVQLAALGFSCVLATQMYAKLAAAATRVRQHTIADSLSTVRALVPAGAFEYCIQPAAQTQLYRERMGQIGISFLLVRSA